MTGSIIRYAGLDVHKRVVEACLVDPSGQIVHRARFALNRHTLKLFATKILRPTDRRSALVGQRTAMRNRIHSVLAVRLVETPQKLFNGAGRGWLAAAELDDQARLLVDSDLRQLDFLQKEIDALDDELARRGHASAEVKLLMTRKRPRAPCVAGR
jgi:transposase